MAGLQGKGERDSGDCEEGRDGESAGTVRAVDGVQGEAHA